VIVDVGTVVAVEKSGGRIVWRSESFPAGYASPVPFEDKVAVINNGGAALIRPDGLTFCKRPVKSEADGTGCDPLVVGGNLFCIFSGAGCAMLQPEFPEFKIVWQGKQFTSLFANPVYWNGCIFGLEGPAGHMALTCVDAQSGTIKWSGPALETATMILADGKVIILCEGGELILVAADGEAYKELARAKVITGPCSAPPALSAGRLYCRNTAGELICLNFR
jgi:outer membrane protein assembly factor BamB